ncbi:MAG TPA: hypothetical protein VGM13_08690 [Thermoanaerobaculia bacterium]|jgi:hypothetical protein
MSAIPKFDVVDPSREAGNDFGEETRGEEQPNPYRQTPGQALAKIGRLGAAIPLDELPSFNDFSEGGQRSGEAIAIAGPSGVGKTSLGVMYAKRSVELGRPTSGYFVDQSPAAASVRLGQLFGLDRAELEDPKRFPGVPMELDRLVAALPAPLFFTEVDEDGVNVTANAADLRLVAAGRESTLIVDSGNLAPVPNVNGDEERLRIRDTALAIARERKKYDMAVVVTYETNRSAGPLAVYGPGLLDLEFRVDLLATVAESRAIAHAFDRVVVMFGDPERAVRAFFVKNRRGRKGDWWMRMDRVTSGWAEIPPEVAEEQIRHDAEERRDGKSAKYAATVLDFLKKAEIEGKAPCTKAQIEAGTGLHHRAVSLGLDALVPEKAYIDTTAKRQGARALYRAFTR